MIASLHLMCQINQLENMYRTTVWNRSTSSLKDIFSRNVLSNKFRTNRLANKKVFQLRANRPSPYIVVVVWGGWVGSGGDQVGASGLHIVRRWPQANKSEQVHVDRQTDITENITFLLFI